MELYYFSRPSCGVCSSVRPKIEMLLQNKYPDVQFVYVNLDNDEEFAGKYMIFTIPAIIFFIDSKEFFRFARYMSINEIDEKLERYTSFTT